MIKNRKLKDDIIEDENLKAFIKAKVDEIKAFLEATPETINKKIETEKQVI